MPTSYCTYCDRSFSNRFNFIRHQDSLRCKKNHETVFSDPAVSFPCEYCDLVFDRSFNLRRHKSVYHPLGRSKIHFQCGICSTYFKTKEEVETHKETTHRTHNDFQLIQSAHHRQCQLLRAFFPANIKTMDEGLHYAMDRMEKLVEALAVDLNFFKLNFIMTVEMYRLNDRGEIYQTQSFPFRGFGLQISNGRTEDGVYKDLARICGDFERNVDEFLYRGSGWIVSRPVFLEAEVVQCQPLAGGSCGVHEAVWARTKGVQVQTSRMHPDGDCFYNAIASYFLGEKVKENLLSDFVAKMSRLPVTPVRVADIATFEQTNKHLDCNINVVYKDERETVIPIRAGKNMKAKNQIVLILFNVRHQSGEEEEEGEETGPVVNHYALVRSPEKLFAKRFVSETGQVQKTSNVFLCYNCLNTQKTRGAHSKHVAYCHQNECQIVRMPSEGEVLSFEEKKKKATRVFKSAFMLFFDFESLQVTPEKPCTCTEEVLENTRRERERQEKWDRLTLDEQRNIYLDERTAEGQLHADWECRVFDAMCTNRRPPRFPRTLPRPKKKKVCTHKTFVLKEQPPFAYSLVLVDRDGKVREKKAYVGLDAAENFVQTVLNISDKYLPSLSPGVPMESMSDVERALLRSTDVCYLCETVIQEDEKRCLDHDHLNGKFLGVAHNLCNLRRREAHVLSCFAHNFQG